MDGVQELRHILLDITIDSESPAKSHAAFLHYYSLLVYEYP